MAIILGIRLDNLSRAELMDKISSFVNGSEQHYVVTPNPEIILAAHQDEEFFYVLNSASLSLPDGFGLIIAAHIFGEKLTRLTGSDMTPAVLKMAEEQGIKVMVLNREDGLSKAEEITTTLKNKFPNLNYRVLDIKRDVNLDENIILKINEYEPKILFNTLGFPYQEKLMYHNLKKLPSVKVAFGVGGSFDYLSGRISRGPKILRRLGLEWFWRLINAGKFPNSKKRVGRIFRATFVFMAKVIKNRFVNPLCYRPNVAIFLYRQTIDGPEVLIVQRRDDSDHWQLPQGGTDGQSLSEAGAREAREELGTDKFVMKAVFKNVHRYKFYNQSRAITNDLKGYKFEHKGQSQGLFIAEFTGQDEDIKTNFWDHVGHRWVKVDDLVNSVHPYRQTGAIKFLEKFKTLKIN